MTDDVTWSNYYEENEGRDPREMLIQTLETYAEPGEAVDLGCGAGIDTLAMLTRGWRVFATDAEEEAIARLLARVPAELEPRLSTQVSPMEEVQLPRADLLLASFSLFFCDPDRFPDVWRRIGASLRDGGRFVGQLLGERDTWAPEDDISSFSVPEARAIFDGWSIERFEEEDEDGEACSGPKHWHVFHVIARTAGASDDAPGRA
jgi:SAM-dependent methyltransferase